MLREPAKEETASNPGPAPRLVLAREAHRSYKAMRELDGSLADYGPPDPPSGEVRDRQLAGLVMTIVCINAWNRMAITTRSPEPGSYQSA